MNSTVVRALGRYPLTLTHVLLEGVIEDTIQITLLNLLTLLRRLLCVDHNGAEHRHGFGRKFRLPIETIQERSFDVCWLVLPCGVLLRTEILLGVRLQRVQIDE